MPEISEKLHELGVENVDMTGIKELWQRKVLESTESMCDKYPEFKGYIGKIQVADLPKGVFACTGPRMDKETGFSTEIQLSKEIFSKSNLELKVVDMEYENFKGERWFAGRGLDGILKHEMAHALHLRILAENEGIHLGDYDKEKYDAIMQKYYRNSVIATMCYDAVKEAGIQPRDIARNLSTYGASDMGELFAEAISEYETAKEPRTLAIKVHEKYQNYVSNMEKEGK